MSIKWFLIWTALHSVSIYLILISMNYVEITNSFIELLGIGLGVTILAGIYRVFTGNKRFIITPLFLLWWVINSITIWLISMFIFEINSLFVSVVLIGIGLVITSYLVHFFHLLNFRGIKLGIIILVLFLILFFGVRNQSENYIGQIITPEIDNSKTEEPEEPESINYKDKLIEIKEKLIQEFNPDSDKNMQILKEKNMNAFNYLNNIRQENNVPILKWDDRVYNLGIARVKDMYQYNYMDHTNPETGSCPDNIKQEYGLNYNEYVAENAYGMQGADAHPKSAIDSWMTSRGHRYNLLYSSHTGGTIACYRGYCVFLGLNYDRFGEGCYTGEEGMDFWNSAGRQPGEI